MKFNNIIYQNIQSHLNIEIAKPNLDAIYTTDWLNFDSPNFQSNINKTILTNDAISYLSHLSNYQLVEFLIGFHAINFQYWKANHPSGFSPYIHDGLSGFYACLKSYLQFFKHTETSRLTRSITQIDFFTCFGEIPNSKDRFQFLIEVWKPEILDNVSQMLEDDINKGCLCLDTAYKISKIIPSCFDDPFLRKSTSLLWDFHCIKNNKNIQIDLPLIADHQTAKILSMYNMIIYNDELKNKIINGNLIKASSEEELAIRACIVFVGEHIKKRKNLNSLELYQVMWQMRASKNEPFFLCVNQNY